MKRMLVGIIIVCSLLASANAATVWKKLANGLSYTTIARTAGIPKGAIHAFRINLNYYRLELAFTHNENRPLITVKDLVQKKGAVVGINGGFFNPNLTPLGLRIRNGKIVSPLKRITWWSLFIVKGKKARIISKKYFVPSRKINFAVQSGPRLIINGRIPSLKPGVANRSALGITKSGKIIIAVTQNLPLSTTAFAKILLASTNQNGLGCLNALNLDGGRSSQLYARVYAFSLNIPSLAPVADAVLVLPR